MIKKYPVSSPIKANDQAQGFTESGQQVRLIFIAPIDLILGDICTVETDDGTLLSVERDGKIIWKRKKKRPNPITSKGQVKLEWSEEKQDWVTVYKKQSWWEKLLCLPPEPEICIPTLNRGNEGTRNEP